MIVEGADGTEYGYAADFDNLMAEIGYANGAGLVRKWKSLGLLDPAGTIGRRPYFAVKDVLAVELQQRKAAATRPGGRRRLTCSVAQFTM